MRGRSFLERRALFDLSGQIFSDKSLTALAKHMQQELIPPSEDNEEDSKLSSTKSMLPLRIIEQAVKSVLSRNNYGLEALNGLKTPAAVCVWRWEVKENHKNWLPKSVREKAEARLLERMRVCNVIVILILMVFLPLCRQRSS